METVVQGFKICYLEKRWCKSCGGRCCRHYPGVALPGDFPTEESVKAALASGQWQVDASPEGAFLRAAGKGIEGKKCTEVYDGDVECTFLGPKGCRLSPLERPSGCRLMIPRAPEKCVAPITAEVAIREWSGRSAELLRLEMTVRSEVATLSTCAHTRGDRSPFRKEGIGDRGVGKGVQKDGGVVVLFPRPSKTP